MLTYTDLPLLPVKVMGSHGTPGWLWAFRDAVADGKAGPDDIEEAMTDAAKVAILDMTEAGADIISDGEMFRADLEKIADTGVHCINAYNLRVNERTPVMELLSEDERLERQDCR